MLELVPTRVVVVALFGPGNGQHLPRLELYPARDAVGLAERVDADLVALGDRFQALPRVDLVRTRAVVRVAFAIRVVVFILACRRGHGRVGRMRGWVERTSAAAVRIVEAGNGQLLARLQALGFAEPVRHANRLDRYLVALGDRIEPLPGVDDV